MATLYVVRHGQASFEAADYDQLSPLGARQAELLGAWVTARGLAVNRTVVGPLKRHRQSYEAFLKGRGVAEPAPSVVDDGLEEYRAFEVLADCTPGLAASDERVAQLISEIAEGGESSRRARELLFQRVSGAWVDGEVVSPRGGTFVGFREMVDAAVVRMTTGATRGESVWAFTSGGVVAAAAGRTLGLTDRAVLELSWRIKNASFSAFTFNAAGRVTLSTLNETPHLTTDDVVTYR